MKDYIPAFLMFMVVFVLFTATEVIRIVPVDSVKRLLDYKALFN